MLQYMMTIEDLEALKQAKDYELGFRRVVRYRDCRYTLRQVLDKHLQHLMCDSKRKSFTHQIFVIEATQKMPVDAMEFDYVYVSLLDVSNIYYI